MNKNDELLIYRKFFHQIQMNMFLNNSEKVAEALNLINNWSRAHKDGNGLYTEKEQKRLINNQIDKIAKYR